MRKVHLQRDHRLATACGLSYFPECVAKSPPVKIIDPKEQKIKAKQITCLKCRRVFKKPDRRKVHRYVAHNKIACGKPLIYRNKDGALCYTEFKAVQRRQNTTCKTCKIAKKEW